MRTFVVNNINLSGLSQKWRMLRNRIYKNRIVFIHVPKSGGTSFSQVMRALYCLSFFTLDQEASLAAASDLSGGQWMSFKRRLAVYHIAKEIHYIQGHFPIDSAFLDAHLGDYKFVTMLREPVDRVISHYYFDRHILLMSPAEFIESERGLIETRVLCHFFGGLDWDTPGDVDAAAQRAIANLERFSIVGILEDQDNFARQVHEKLGVKLTLPKRNVGVVRRTTCELFGPAEHAQLEALCAADKKIYDHFLAKARSSAAA